jgi:hypothetical protein
VEAAAARLGKQRPALQHPLAHELADLVTRGALGGQGLFLRDNCVDGSLQVVARRFSVAWIVTPHNSMM